MEENKAVRDCVDRVKARWEERGGEGGGGREGKQMDDAMSAYLLAQRGFTKYRTLPNSVILLKWNTEIAWFVVSLLVWCLYTEKKDE